MRHSEATLAGSEKEKVRLMFDRIAERYDFLNHFLSLGTDRKWRKNVISILEKVKPKQILDVATGTADLALAALKLSPEKITGIDISEKMILIGNEKIRNQGAESFIQLETGDAENLRFEKNSFDAVTVAFGVRNFENTMKGLSEMLRVLKPGGTIVILEFSVPQNFPVKQLFGFYFHRILPFFGKIISKDKFAYRYLPDSVKDFPCGNDFLKRMAEAGFTQNNFKELSFGIASIYTGKKP